MITGPSRLGPRYLAVCPKVHLAHRNVDQVLNLVRLGFIEGVDFEFS